MGTRTSPFDQVDDALEADARGRRALWISLGGLAVTAALQGVVAVPLLVAFRLAQKAPTMRYTYGYGRAEDLGGLFVVAMIPLSAGLAAYEAVDRLLHPRPVEHL